jgi:hypothetical protein
VRLRAGRHLGPRTSVSVAAEPSTTGAGNENGRGTRTATPEDTAAAAGVKAAQPCILQRGFGVKAAAKGLLSGSATVAFAANVAVPRTRIKAPGGELAASAAIEPRNLETAAVTDTDAAENVAEKLEVRIRLQRATTPALSYSHCCTTTAPAKVATL